MPHVQNWVLLHWVDWGVAWAHRAGEDDTHQALTWYILQCCLCAAISGVHAEADLALPCRCHVQPKQYGSIKGDRWLERTGLRLQTACSWQCWSRNSVQRTGRRVLDACYLCICGRRVGAASIWCIQAFSGVPCSWARYIPLLLCHLTIGYSQQKMHIARLNHVKWDQIIV